MNQILYVQGRTKKISEIKKIIKVFSLVIAIFGIILIGEGCYSLYKSIEHNKVVAAAKVPPTANIEVTDDNVIIHASSDKTISKLEYNWNNDDPIIIDGNNKQSIEEKIKLPVTTSTLHIKVIDMNNNITETEKEVSIKNDIRLSVLNNNQIKIVAEDQNGIAKISYKWNNDNVIEMNTNNTQTIEKEIDIPVGLNTLEVVITNSQGNQSKKTLEVKGVTKPVINVERDGEFIIVKVNDEIGLTKIVHKLNDGEEQSIPVNGNSITYKQKLVAGENNINIKAYNKNDTYTEFNGKCEL